MVPPIAIIGAGPTGLTLARFLECRGIDYVVYERDAIDAPNRAGGSLDIHVETGQKALRSCGLFEEFKKQARYEDQGFRIYGPDGAFHANLTDLMPEAGEEERPEIDRGALRQILLDSVPKKKIQWGNGLASISVDGGVPTLRFTDGSSASGFKLVVGADGAWSKVRPMLNKSKPHHSGQLIIESRVTKENPIFDRIYGVAGHGTMSALGPSKNILLQRQGDGSYRVYLVLLVDEEFHKTTLDTSNVEATRSLMLSEPFFGGWDTLWKEMVQTLPDFRLWPLYYLPAEEISWSTVPGFTLAGDAAHLALPNGEGVNCGMTDAMCLAESLTKHGLDNVEAATREYEAEMFVRGKASVVEGIQLNESMIHKDNPQAFFTAIQSGLLGG